MSNAHVQKQMRAYLYGNTGEQTAALTAMRKMAASESSLDSEEQRATLGRMVSDEIIEDEHNQKRLKFAAGRWLGAQNLENSVALMAREREVGQELVNSIEENRWRFQEAHQGEALSTISEIARLRSSGKAKDQSAAQELERKFYADPNNVDNKELQRVLADTPGMEYLQAGLGATARLSDRLSRQPGRGQTKAGRLLQHSLRAAGLGGTKLLDSERKLLKTLTDTTDPEAAEALQDTIRSSISSRLKGRDLANFESRQFIVDEALKVSAGGVSAGEARTYASQFGAGEARGLRLEGAPAERTATSELQQKILTSMKKQQILQLEIARNTGTSAEWLKHNITQGKHWKLGGAPGNK